MRRIILLMFSFLCILQATGAQHIAKYTIDFSEKDYRVETSDDGLIYIIPQDITVGFPDIAGPCLPFVPTDMAIPGNRMYISSSQDCSMRLICTDARMAESPEPMPTDRIPVEGGKPLTVYTGDSVYPESVCEYVGTSEGGMMNILHFLSSPFVYYGKERRLYFVDRFELTVITEDADVPGDFRSEAHSREDFRSIVWNKAEVEDIMASVPRAMAAVSDTERIDYVIITNEALKEAFEPLRRWKKRKGLYSKIITMEEVETGYPGNDSPLKLKNCLYDLYKNHSLQYVLLGGDDTVVPVRGCYGQYGKMEDFNIPTDLYYSCLYGDLDWDKNKNGIYGEADDGVQLLYSLYVTRLPVRTKEDVNNYILKLLKYEKSPVYFHKLLMGGVKLEPTDTTNGHSNRELQGDMMYEGYIRPYWDGQRDKIYDTFTSFPGGADYDITGAHLADKIALGYGFIDLSCHGMQTEWWLENNSRYNTTHGCSQYSPCSTIITTTACHTNAFDCNRNGPITQDKDPCLSESLIRNPNSGVIGYLGCSR